MSNITSFKEFVKKNPSLVKYVKNNEMSWQKFYEMYDLYGEDNEIWDSYLGKVKNAEVKEVANKIGFADVITWLKGIDMDSVQNNINNIQRVVGVLQDFGSTNDKGSDTYKPRPIYKHFED